MTAGDVIALVLIVVLSFRTTRQSSTIAKLRGELTIERARKAPR